MAEEPQIPTPEVVPPVVELAEKPVDAADEKTAPVSADTAPAAAAAEEVVVEAEEKPQTPSAAEEEKKNQIAQSQSFKEETNVVGDLPEAQKKALDDLKLLIQEALNKHELSAPPPPPPKAPEVVAVPPEEADKKEENKEEAVVAAEEKKEEAAVAVEEKKEEEKPASTSVEPQKEAEVEVTKKEEAVAEVVVVEKVSAVVEVEDGGSKTVEAIEETVVTAAIANTEEENTEVVPSPPEEVEIWGIPLLADERSDVILLKFLRARDFKVKDAFTMIKNTVRWRKEFGIDALVEEDLGSDWDRVVFTDGYDKEGHPVCYNVFGEFEDKELYQKTFSDEEKRNRFIRWRIQFLEKSVRKLDFSPTGISTIVQVNDLRNSPGLGKRDLRLATNQALQLLQDNYPEFVAKQIFINVPWWYLAFSRMISAFLTQRTKSKFVFAGPSKSAETLFKYIAPELVPVQYGGLSREGDQEFTTADPVTEFTIKPATKHTVEVPFSEKSHLVWEVRVVGWDVNYGAEFLPSAEDGYTVIVQKSRKIAPTDETVITNSFKIGEPGKVVLTIDNQTSKKKKLLYRSKTKPISE